MKITAAKGRPMLVRVGKRPLAQVAAFPAQHVETFDPSGALGRKPVDTEHWKDWPQAYPRGGLLFHGDNKEVLAHLLANGFCGNVNLICVVCDVPEKKTDLVQGRYELPGPDAQTTVAVKIIDMLGEEALLVEQV